MEASMWPVTKGAIMEYIAPFNKEVCDRYGMLSTHLVMIINERFPKPSARYQAFMLSSKCDNYYGYRIYVNTIDHRYRGYGMINTTEIYTIDARRLGSIVGFAPLQLVDRCKEAYAYEIGLSDKVPEYYQDDVNIQGWLHCGEPNRPKSPKLFSDDNGHVNTFTIASPHYRPSAVADPRPVGVNVRPVINITPAQSAEIQPNPAELENAPDDKVADATPEVAEDTPDDVIQDVRTEDIVSSGNEDAIAKIKAMRVAFSHRGKDDVMTKEFHEYLQSRRFDESEPPAAIRDIYNAMSAETKYGIYMEKIHMADLVRMGICNTPANARKLTNYVIVSLDRDRNNLLQGVIDKSIDLRFIMDKMILAYRILTLSDIHDIHMGIATYDSYASRYGLDPGDTYIGEMRRGEII